MSEEAAGECRVSHAGRRSGWRSDTLQDETSKILPQQKTADQILDFWIGNVKKVKMVKVKHKLH